MNSDPNAIRAARRWLAIACRVAAAEAPGVRFGFTAGRRHAKRAVDRNAVKRVLREAARARLLELDAAAGSHAVDVVLRLKAPLPEAFRAALRAEADSLLEALAQRLRAVAS